MIPINYNRKYGCTVISSACVLWQGEDISCIDICQQDTIQDVIQKLGNKICEINNYLSPLTYDLSCFNFGACPPDTFHDLFQFVLDSICTLNTINNVGENGTIDLSAFKVPLASCLQFVDEYGNQIIQLPLYDDEHNDYVTYIGSKICDLTTSMTQIQTNFNLLQQQFLALQNTIISNTHNFPLVTLLTGFEGISTTNVELQYSQLLYRLEEYIDAISIAYEGTVLQYNNGIQMFSPNKFNTIYNEMLSSPYKYKLCSSASLTLSNTKSIIDAFKNIWEYIKDIRSIISLKLCTQCTSCTAINEIKLTYNFLSSTQVSFTMTLPSGYSLSGPIYYTVYNNDNTLNISSSSMSNIFTIDNNTIPVIDYFIIHVNGCITNSTTEECKYEFTIPVFNPYYGCFVYKNVIIDINSIDFITTP